MLNRNERAHLAQLASKGNDGENLVTFYEGYSNRRIPEEVYIDHLRNLYDAFQQLELTLADGRQFLMSDDISIADAFWSMKILKLIELSYPVDKYHPNLYDWYQRVYARPSFQNEVMSKNHGLNRFFRAKSLVENSLGLGLRKVLREITS